MKHTWRDKSNKRYLEAIEYENFISATFEALVSQDLGTVFPKRTYVGKKSGHNHEIDLSIELRIAEISILILIECKHYKNNVEISDVLEFVQRIDDIGAHKGVLVSTRGFQVGAVKVAEGYGIALVTTEPQWAVILGIIAHDDYVVGATLRLLNDPSYPSHNLHTGWRSVINYLYGKRECSSCGKIIKNLLDYQGKGISHDVCIECFLSSRRCISCNEISKDIGAGLCEECFFLKLELHCDRCSRVIRKILKGFCQGCFSSINESKFAESTWYKCECRQMIHISDVNARTAKCSCGHIVRFNELKRKYESEVRKDTDKYFLVRYGYPKSSNPN